MQNHNDDKKPSSTKQISVSPSSPKRKKKKRDGSTLRKAPQAPKRFKSSYICFFTAKQSEIKAELGEMATITEISKRSAQMWKRLSTEDRRFWDEIAEKDKQRYMLEKASYAPDVNVMWQPKAWFDRALWAVAN